MGLGIIIILVGLIIVGFGLSRDEAGRALLALGGWVVFLTGILITLVPGFFRGF